MNEGKKNSVFCCCYYYLNKDNKKNKPFNIFVKVYFFFCQNLIFKTITDSFLLLFLFSSFYRFVKKIYQSHCLIVSVLFLVEEKEVEAEKQKKQKKA